MQNRAQSMETLSSMNNCGDEFTSVPDSYVAEIESATRNARASLIYVLLCFAATLLSLCLYVFSKTVEVTTEDHFKRDNTAGAD